MKFIVKVYYGTSIEKTEIESSTMFTWAESGLYYFKDAEGRITVTFPVALTSIKRLPDEPDEIVKDKVKAKIEKLS